MKRANELVICKDDYKTKEDFENAIKEAIMVLLNNNYIMTVRYDDKGIGIVSIEYNYAKEEYGDYYPRWLLPEEYETVFMKKQDMSNEDLY